MSDLTNGNKWQLANTVLTVILTAAMGLLASVFNANSERNEEMFRSIAEDRQKNASYQRQVDVNTGRIQEMIDDIRELQRGQKP